MLDLCFEPAIRTVLKHFQAFGEKTSYADHAKAESTESFGTNTGDLIVNPSAAGCR